MRCLALLRGGYEIRFNNAVARKTDPRYFFFFSLSVSLTDNHCRSIPKPLNWASTLFIETESHVWPLLWYLWIGVVGGGLRKKEFLEPANRLIYTFSMKCNTILQFYRKQLLKSFRLILYFGNRHTLKQEIVLSAPPKPSSFQHYFIAKEMGGMMWI